MRLTPALLISILIVPAPTLADLYKWTDSNGQVHYSDQVPAGTESKRLGPSSNPQRERDAEAARRALADRVSQSKQQRQQEQDSEEKKLAEAEQKRKKEEACRQARERLAVLNHNGPIARVNEQGERYYMDAAQRQSEIDATQRRVDEVCK